MCIRDRSDSATERRLIRELVEYGMSGGDLEALVHSVRSRVECCLSLDALEVNVLHLTLCTLPIHSIGRVSSASFALNKLVALSQIWESLARRDGGITVDTGTQRFGCGAQRVNSWAELCRLQLGPPDWLGSRSEVGVPQGCLPCDPTQHTSHVTCLAPSDARAIILEDKDLMITPPNVASGSADHSVMVWCGGCHRPLARLSGHTNSVCSICWLGTDHVFSGGVDRRVLHWTLDEAGWRLAGEVVAAEHTRHAVTAVASWREGDDVYVAAGTATGKLLLSRLGDGLLACEQKHAQPILVLECDCSNGFIVSLGADGTVAGWDSHTLECLWISTRLNSASIVKRLMLDTESTTALLEKHARWQRVHKPRSNRSVAVLVDNAMILVEPRSLLMQRDNPIGARDWLLKASRYQLPTNRLVDVGSTGNVLLAAASDAVWMINPVDEQIHKLFDSSVAISAMGVATGVGGVLMLGHRSGVVTQHRAAELSGTAIGIDQSQGRRGPEVFFWVAMTMLVLMGALLAGQH
eukprot:TRINITY_DN21562_c0_g1_i1.p1 TRINITY_DN21562_c0_g1~~TRINITY_DN21562_c0_g1_i1.p1  ORF type:complete len:523 (-),score=68.52 TRINITY_DN21562_c0_g1_i1:153-1721(-)